MSQIQSFSAPFDMLGDDDRHDFVTKRFPGDASKKVFTFVSERRVADIVPKRDCPS